MQVIIEPVITEKSLTFAADSKFTFKVAQAANKVQIALAVEDIFKVHVVNVKIINVDGKQKLVKGRYKITTSPWKKAIVTLKKGERIPGYEMPENK